MHFREKMIFLSAEYLEEGSYSSSAQLQSYADMKRLRAGRRAEKGGARETDAVSFFEQRSA